VDASDPGGDLDRVNVRTRHEFPEIPVGRAIGVAAKGVHHLFALGALYLVHVAYGHHLHLRITEKCLHVIGALDAQPDHAKYDPFRRCHETRLAQGPGGDELPRANRPAAAAILRK